MLGKAFIGKILYRVEDALKPEEQRRASSRSIGGMDAVLAGHLAQAAPIGDDPVWKIGPCTGKGLNKPPDRYRGPDAPTLAEFVNKAKLFLGEFEDVAFLRCTHRVDEDGDPSWSEERRSAYRREALRFLGVTRKMADL